jgi:AraC family transcriptional regulator of arabinose operon
MRVMDQRVQIVIELMQGRMRRGVSLNELAVAVNLSLSHLHHLFKAETGTSPTQYLRTLRMAQAKELLESTFLSVKQITASIGLRDPSHFEREFKKVYGLTPSQYRMAARLVLSSR